MIVALLGGGSTVYLWHSYTKAGPFLETRRLWIKKGERVEEIAGALQQEAIIADPFFFKLGVWISRTRIKAGEYDIPPASSIRSILKILREGKPILRKLTVPEGLTSFDILALLHSSQYLEGDLPELPPPEGSLLPETYFFERGENRSALLDRLMQAMRDKLAQLWAARDPDLPLKDVEEALILASLVEKETSLPEERSRIAAVFYNRLSKGMKLQTDPSVIYALTSGKAKLERPLTRGDLAYESPYNTYWVEGLPPAPIANPGVDSITAVLHPIKSKELYFVADGTGGHAFAETLEQHNRNVAKWRKLQKALP